MTRRLQSLEAVVGVPLLVREGRRSALTPAARELVEQLRGPLAGLESALESLVGESDPDHGVVRLGFPLSMGSGLIPELLAKFHRRHPGIRLRLEQAHGSALTARLLDCSLDMAIVIPPPPTVSHTIVGHQEIVAVMSEGHKLAGRASIEVSDLREETFIVNPPSYHLRAVTESWCAEAGFSPDSGVEITEFATMRELVHRGLGVALLPSTGGGRSGVVEVPLAGERRRDIALAWSAGAGTPVGQRLSGYLMREFSGRRGGDGR